MWYLQDGWTGRHLIILDELRPGRRRHHELVKGMSLAKSDL